jgi:acetoin utilization protein AcuB
MPVSHRMTQNPVTVAADDLLIQAWLKMQKGGSRRPPVVSDVQVVGIITDRDMREHAGYLDRIEVTTAMSKKPITVTLATTVDVAAQLLLKHKVGGLPVVEKGRVVGMITTTDILQAFLDVMGASEETSTRIDFVLEGEGRGLAEASRIINRG